MEPKKRGRPKLEASSLSAKHAQFCREYIIDLNAAAAAKRAGYSAATAPQIACRMMADPRIHEEIALLMSQRSKRTEVTADMVVHELANAVLFDPRDVMTWDVSGVTIRPSSQLTGDQARCISKVTETRTPDGEVVVKVEFHDRNTAIEKLMRHLGMNKDKVEQTGNLQLIVATNVNGGEK